MRSYSFYRTSRSGSSCQHITALLSVDHCSIFRDLHPAWCGSCFRQCTGGLRWWV